jgi:hypothetical protein
MKDRDKVNSSTSSPIVPPFRGKKLLFDHVLTVGILQMDTNGARNNGRDAIKKGDTKGKSMNDRPETSKP